MLPAGHIYGLSYISNIVDPINHIDIYPGSCRSDDDVGDIKLTSTITKRLDSPWSEGNGGGGIDIGDIADGTYHIWAIARSDTGAADIIMSLSSTNPTMPVNYDLKRRRGAVIRKNGSVVPFSLSGNTTLLKTPACSVGANHPGTSAVLAPLHVPNGVQVTAIIWVFLRTTENVRRAVLITSPDQNAVMPSAGTMSTFATGLDGLAGGTTTGELLVRTNTSRQIRYQLDGSSSATALFITTCGWIDEV